VFVRSSDPLSNPGPLIRRTYAYVAYRLGDGPDAEDVTSATIERALRYRKSYDPRKGDPISWLIGIARSCVADHVRAQPPTASHQDVAGSADLEAEVLRRLSVGEAVAGLDERDQELIALRYGADLSARAIADLLGMTTNAVDVALHRSRERLRGELIRVGYAQESRSHRRIGDIRAEAPS
jgi:RNA polymerase sigma factor (sigma-70 family)